MPKAPGTKVGGQPSRSPVLTNEDVAVRTGPLTIIREIMRDPSERVETVDPVAEARAYLESLRGRFEPTVQDAAETDRLIAEGVARQQEMAARPGATRPLSLADIAGAVAETGRGMQMGGLVPSPASLPLLAGGTAVRALGRLGQGVADPVEEGMGLGEAAGEAATLAFPIGSRVIQAVRGARSARAAGEAAKGAADLRRTFRVGERFRPQEAPQRVEPYQVRRMRPDLYTTNVQRQGRPAEEAIELVTGGGVGAPDPANLSRTRTFGDLRERIGAPANLSRQRTFGDLRERLEQGVRVERSTPPAGPSGGPTGGAPSEEDVLRAALTPYTTRVNPTGLDVVPTEYLPRSWRGIVQQAGPEIDLTREVGRLSELDQAARAARMRERFGRVYRRE